jgi:hypothetical protein
VPDGVLARAPLRVIVQWTSEPRLPQNFAPE